LLLSYCVKTSEAVEVSEIFKFSNLQTGDTAPPDGDGIFTPTTIEGGIVLVAIVAKYPVEICFQEGSYALGSLAQVCNSEGFIPATTYSIGNETYNLNTSLYLRNNLFYGVTARWAISEETNPPSITGDVTVYVYYNACPAGDTGYGPNCTISPITGLSPSGYLLVLQPASQAMFTFSLDDTVFYSFFTINVVYSSQSNEGEKTRLRRRSAPPTTTPLQVYSRRDAYPMIIDNSIPIFDPPSFNSTSAANRTVSLTYVGPETGTWYVLIENVASTSYIFNATLQLGTFGFAF